jgi:orotate phosphoribosyltransferase
MPAPPFEAPPDRAGLLDILAHRSLAFGEFRLSSGATSSFYIDVRRTSLDPEGAHLIGRLACDAFARQIEERTLTAVGGLTLGADPIVVAMALEARTRGVRLEAFLVRKQAKEHGAGRRVEGNLTAGSRALVVEDVCTSGESALAAVAAARAEGATVDCAWCVVDRGAGGREALARAGVALTACFTLEEVLGATPEGRAILAGERPRASAP